MNRTLVVTNDFPTRQGGIESFIHALCTRFDPETLVVHTATMPGAAEFDANLPFRVVRDPSTTLLPTPATTKRVVASFAEHGCDRVLFGASAPLGLMAGALRDAGAQRVVGITHGHEVWWASVPGARALLRRIGDGCDVLTYVSVWCRDQISAALSDEAAARMLQLSPGVDTSVFHPGVDGGPQRAAHGIATDRPVLICVARLVPRKGQDTLIAAMPAILAAIPDALLVIVGGGSHDSALKSAARDVGVEDSVLFVGPVTWAQTPGWFAAGNVFAMPCRTRLGGLEPEAFGIVFLEAQATGLPVLVGNSGGAPETVIDGETGFVVDPRDTTQIAERAIELLSDPQRAVRMGEAGRVWAANFEWDAIAARLQRILAGDQDG